MGAQAGAKYDGTTHHASGADELAVQVTSRPVTPYRLRPFGCHTVVLSRKIGPPPLSRNLCAARSIPHDDPMGI